MLTDHSLIAVFIEPSGLLEVLLRERKAWLEAVMPGQPYCSHPPHSTLLFGDYGPVALWKNALAHRLREVAPFAWSTDAWHVFPDDPLAGGGQTVALRGSPTPAVFALQRAVAEVLGAFNRADPTQHPLASREPFGSSLRQFGFPFVGSHWLPHFTIGSPRVSRDAPLVSQLQAGSPVHRFSVETVALWFVNGEQHTRIEIVPLGG